MDLFIRKINVLYRKREFPPLLSSVNPDRRALVNEISFHLFKTIVDAQVTHIIAPETSTLESYFLTASELARYDLKYIERTKGGDLTEPNEIEKQESFEQTRRIYTFFKSRVGGNWVRTSPRFPGCGIIDTCYGDAYINGCLFEVKAGDRQFRSIDVRQLLTYAALNKLSSSYELRRIGLFNPRIGVSWTEDINEVCQEVAGRQTDDFLDELIRVISSGDISR
jgi:hypothetical protein